MGITTYLNQNYNPFVDSYTPIIMIIWILISIIVDWPLRKLGMFLNFWGYKDYKSKVRP